MFDPIKETNTWILENKYLDEYTYTRLKLICSE